MVDSNTYTTEESGPGGLTPLPIETGGFSLLAWLLFALVTLLWAAYAVAWWAAPDTLASFWEWSASLPMAARIGLWVIGLPWMAAVALWQSDWPDAARVLVSLGLAWATMWSFFPGRAA